MVLFLCDWACMALFGAGMRGLFGGCAWFYLGGACVVLFGGAKMHGFDLGGACVVF